MASEPVTGGLFLAASSAGVMAGGFLGPLNFPLEDFGWATLFAMIGALGRAVLDAKASRDKAIAAGIENRNLPRFDLVSLVYALFGAPLVGGIALASVRGLGFLPDWSAAPVIMGLGYMGRDGVNAIVGLFRDFVGQKIGKKDG